jgi:hypothetical protein
VQLPEYAASSRPFSPCTRCFARGRRVGGVSQTQSRAALRR